MFAKGWLSFGRERVALHDPRAPAQYRARDDMQAHDCLSEAKLSGADLSEAVLIRAKYDDETRWPEGFIPPSHAIKVET